ncbi:MAG: DM13 domain-containing protein [Crocosphaera sp.]
MQLNRFTTFALSCALFVPSLTVFSSTTLANAIPNNLIAQQVNVLASNNFVTVDQDHQTTGTVRLIRRQGKRYLEFDSRFTTATGPDVQIILYRGQQVPVNISEENYITLAPLKSFTGAQRYEIPDHLNLNDLKSVGIWCRKFNVTFAYASL